jgi:long-chain fatty acid transport protein
MINFKTGGSVYKRSLLILGLIVVLRINLFASGFQINEQGARALAMGGAFVGLANDPTTVYFNPAGMVQLGGTQFSAGCTYVGPMTKFTGPTPSTTESKLKDKYFFPSTFYATHQLSKDWFVGFAFNSPFGFGTFWKDDWIGRYKTTSTEVVTFNVTPTVAYKINDELSVGAGLSVSYSDVNLQKKIQLSVPLGPTTILLPDANLELKGSDISYGLTVSALYKAADDLSFGLTIHSPIKYKYEGTATTTRSTEKDGTLPPAYASAIIAGIEKKLPKGNISAPLTAPMNIEFGAAYAVNKALTLTADLQYTIWTSYDKMEVTFDDMVIDANGTKYVSTSIRDLNNNLIARAGAEYKLNDRIALRCGAYFDKNPIKDERLDPTLPDADRVGLTTGLGYSISDNFKVDVAYMYLKFLDRKITNSVENFDNAGTQKINGKYHTYTHLASINFSYSL